MKKRNFFLYVIIPFFSFLCVELGNSAIEVYNTDQKLRDQESDHEQNFWKVIRNFSTDLPESHTKFQRLTDFKDINVNHYRGLRPSAVSTQPKNMLGKVFSSINSFFSYLTGAGNMKNCDARKSLGNTHGYQNDYDYRMSAIFSKFWKKSVGIGLVTYAASGLFGISDISTIGKMILMVRGVDFLYNDKLGISQYQKLGKFSKKTNEDYQKIRDLFDKKTSNNTTVLRMPKSVFEKSILPGMRSDDYKNLSIRYSPKLKSGEKGLSEEMIALKKT